MPTINVNVTNRNIVLGARESAGWCPVALAIKDALPDSEPHVQAQSVELAFNGERREWALPDDLEDVIDRYDETGNMEPFSFALDISEED